LKLSKTDRLRILLKAIDHLTWREAPPKVGLKTAIDARNRGYIELRIDPQRRYSCRLTNDGRTLKRRLIALERAQANHSELLARKSRAR